MVSPVDRYDALELLWKSLPIVWREAVLEGRTNGYHWLEREEKAAQESIRRMKKLDAEDKVPYTEVMDLMKSICGYAYRKPISETVRARIRVLFAKGYVLQDFEYVFKRQVKKWTGTKYADYLRPSTLLDNFEEYRNTRDAVAAPVQPAHRAQEGATDCPCDGAHIAAAKKAAKGVSDA
jgi:uncharacterized phage protein (TIGR02220 family)